MSYKVVSQNYTCKYLGGRERKRNRGREGENQGRRGNRRERERKSSGLILYTID